MKFWPGWKMPAGDRKVELDLNEPDFLSDLLALDRNTQHAALETLRKIRSLTWSDVYRDNGLKWEKIVGISPKKEISAICSLRIMRARRAIAYRDGNIMRFLTIAPDHDSTYGRK